MLRRDPDLSDVEYRVLVYAVKVSVAVAPGGDQHVMFPAPLLAQSGKGRRMRGIVAFRPPDSECPERVQMGKERRLIQRGKPVAGVGEHRRASRISRQT